MQGDLVSDARVYALLNRLATAPQEIDDLDDSELQEGYRDGRENAPTPGSNRTDSYVHGWWTGMRDGGHRAPHPIDHEIIHAAQTAFAQRGATKVGTA